MHKKSWIIACAAGLACIFVMGTLAYLFDWIPRTKNVELTMYAYELTQDGTVRERFTLTVEGKHNNYRHRTDTLDAEIKALDSNFFTFSQFSNSPYLQRQDFYEKLGVFVSFTFGSYRDESQAFYAFVLDIEEGCMILRKERNGDDSNQYRPCIVASTDPNMTPQEILEHFDWFLLHS